MHMLGAVDDTTAAAASASSVSNVLNDSEWFGTSYTIAAGTFRVGQTYQQCGDQAPIKASSPQCPTKRVTTKSAAA